MIVLGIESTCDETAAAVVKNGREVLSHVVASQTDLHCRLGGVMPELASRQHVDIILPIIDKALQEANCPIDLIAVASEPGLMGALLIGINTAKTLSWSLGIPFVGVNHIEAHLYAAMMETEPTFPAIGVVLSGGHTSILKIRAIGSYELISQTVDDAIGEAFDKVARLLGLPYPGGPEVEKLAKLGNPHAYKLTAGQVKKLPLHFSFSGIKTQVLYQIGNQELSSQQKADLAASFQHTVFTDVVEKTTKIAKEHGCEHIFLGGGVTNSEALRSYFSTSKLKIHFPKREYSLDNGVMIAGLGYHVFQRKGADNYDLTASPRSACLFSKETL
ncbi:MAG: tRNA (adenosine(37)-N6)-threonylcarbamoyltransferase complex transferase subunit TsaD [Chlamydiae bacterium]|nr:tRNA (adenosine(37)-N6)-threonylcarbamoyltransferase complex transferase subunit TsaD [Chlamydiota bacterium]